MSGTSILTLVGSLRKNSANLKFAETAADIAPNGVEVSIYRGLDAIPFYNEDVDVPGEIPAQAARLREAATAADAVLLVSPQYNGTMPAVLKNAIDWLSRPFGQGALKDMPAAVIGTAMGAHGGAYAHNDVRQSLKIAGARVLEDVVLSAPNSPQYAEVHPSESAETKQQIGQVITAVLDSLERAAA